MLCSDLQPAVHHSSELTCDVGKYVSVCATVPDIRGNDSDPVVVERGSGVCPSPLQQHLTRLSFAQPSALPKRPDLKPNPCYLLPTCWWGSVDISQHVLVYCSLIVQ